MKTKSIVITGGPGTGKTTLIDCLQKKGYVCFPEISREVTIAARRNGVEQLFLEKPLLFSELLLEGRKEQYYNALKIGEPFVFLDRGIPDVLAYMHYIGDSYPVVFDETCRSCYYDHVFLLPPWEEIYKPDETRYETFEQANLIFHHLRETYKSFGYSLTEVPIGTPEERVSFIEDFLKVFK